LVGINPDSSAPGMKRVIIKPYFADELMYCTGSREMGEGRLEVAWYKEYEKLILTIQVPKGIEALYKEQCLTEGRYTFIIS